MQILYPPSPTIETIKKISIVNIWEASKAEINLLKTTFLVTQSSTVSAGGHSHTVGNTDALKPIYGALYHLADPRKSNHLADCLFLRGTNKKGRELSHDVGDS